MGHRDIRFNIEIIGQRFILRHVSFNDSSREQRSHAVFEQRSNLHVIVSWHWDVNIMLSIYKESLYTEVVAKTGLTVYPLCRVCSFPCDVF